MITKQTQHFCVTENRTTVAAVLYQDMLYWLYCFKVLIVFLFCIKNFKQNLTVKVQWGILYWFYREFG